MCNAELEGCVVKAVLSETGMSGGDWGPSMVCHIGSGKRIHQGTHSSLVVIGELACS